MVQKTGQCMTFMSGQPGYKKFPLNFSQFQVSLQTIGKNFKKVLHWKIHGKIHISNYCNCGHTKFTQKPIQIRKKLVEFSVADVFQEIDCSLKTWPLEKTFWRSILRPLGVRFLLQLLFDVTVQTPIHQVAGNKTELLKSGSATKLVL